MTFIMEEVDLVEQYSIKCWMILAPSRAVHAKFGKIITSKETV